MRQVGEALAKRGLQVDMFTRKANKQDATVVEHSPNCRTIRLTAGPEEFVPRDNLYGYLPAFVEEFLKFQSSSGVEYPVVHTNYWLSSWVGMELKKVQPMKQVHTYHSLGAVKYKSIATIPMIATTRLAVEKTVLETADRIVATSPQEKKHMRELVSTKGNIDIIPCGTDIRRFGSISKQQARQQLGIDSDTKVVLYVGRFDPRKGIETAVRAVGQSEFRGDAEFKLIIGGVLVPAKVMAKNGNVLKELLMNSACAISQFFPDAYNPNDLPVYYAAADVCVVPSHYEPFGLVAIEAMACGTPVVASDVGGLQFTVVPEETGLLCPPKNAAAFAGAIDRILANPEWGMQMGQAARKRVELKFSWDGVAAQLSELYAQLAASAGSRS